MALSRRTGQRFQASIWPGFVDAMTGLLLVLFFVLSIFMVVQFVLSETISGQESELDALAGEVAALAQALGLEERRGEELDARVGTLTSTLDSAEARIATLTGERDATSAALTAAQTRIAQLTGERDTASAALSQAETRITSFEAQVAALISERDGAFGRISALESDQETLRAAQADLLFEQEALNLALAQARSEIDAGVETARLAAARREALEALVTDLRQRNRDANAAAEQLNLDFETVQAALSEEEVARLAEAAAADALRTQLENSDSELTAMTLALEQQRQEAEDTLTLLAAAEAAQDDLDSQLLAALLQMQEIDNARTGAQETAAAFVAQVAELEQTVAGLQDQLAGARAQTELVESELAGVRSSLAGADSRATGLDVENERLRAALSAAQSQITSLEDAQGDQGVALSEARNRLATLQALAEADKAASEAQIRTLQQANAAAQAEARAQFLALQNRSDADAAEATAQISALNDEKADVQARLTAALQKLGQVEATANLDRDELRKRLRDALAARLAAETLATDQTTEAEKREALLSAAKKALADEEDISTAAQRQATVLNQQVAALRDQLGQLQALLDDATLRDSARDVQLQSLGSELNTALARVAAEERRRRELEEAERQRLEAERVRLEDEQKRLEAQTVDLERYRSEFFGKLRDILGAREGVRIVGDRFVFSSEVLFPPGRANLSIAGQQEIEKIASLLVEVADDIPAEIDWVLQVDGHTDNVPLSGTGEFFDNWELSQARALSVVKYMVNSLGLPPERLSANGFGQYQPLNPLDTSEARAQNRRIEIKFTEK